MKIFNIRNLKLHVSYCETGEGSLCCSYHHCRLMYKHSYFFSLQISFIPNKYSELLSEFLINMNCCILKGRNMLSNDFTCIKGQAASVVDYCLIPHEDLNKFSEFSVHKTTDLINDINIIDTLEPKNSKPDHSILTWKKLSANLTGSLTMILLK